MPAHSQQTTMKFILDLNHLKAGDIILEHCYHPNSIQISKILKSHYSHAMIFTGDKLLEATPDRGVFSRIPNRFAFINRDDVKVMRLIEPLSDELIDAIGFYASTTVGSGYNKTQAIKSVLPEKPSPEIFKGQFCSRLVAQSYSHVGIALVDNINYCTPGDLERSPLLHSVESAIKIATPHEIKHALEPSIHDEHALQTKQWVDDAKKILAEHEKYPESINDIFQCVYDLNNRRVEMLIFNSIKRSGYYDFYLRDKDINHYRYNETLFSKRVLTSVRDIEFEIKKEAGIIKNHSLSLKNSKKNLRYSNNILTKSEVQLHKDVLNISLVRLMVIYGHCMKINFNSHALKASEMMKKIRKALS
ncbi:MULTISPECIES: YiiX/YebB-like N1pC/P60 family cysteine hydrolase [unclassified Pantoea]|uniref:YiiX/YebB-like N1pC/P60 family cysteine hydrolase n=1 Tax=unclassified Pantoea TaxID=2630326 RepID=UPI00226AC5F8|nr:MULTISPECIES: YiiX/YebB-like N1pC/P60 family cysteine hydrolase [unclassified Pantoea]